MPDVVVWLDGKVAPCSGCCAVMLPQVASLWKAPYDGGGGDGSDGEKIQGRGCLSCDRYQAHSWISAQPVQTFKRKQKDILDFNHN